MAVKQLHANLSADPDLPNRFAAMGQLLASIDHPHVVPVLRYIQYPGAYLLVTDFVDGGTLRDRQRAGIRPEEACGLLLGACAGVAAAHAAGVLHRDLQPETILFTGGGRLQVSDFGLAEVIGASRTLASRDGSVLGAPAYMAPELVRSEQPAPASDVYALATILYELLAGQLPFQGGGDALAVMALHVQEQPLDLGAVAPSVPAPLAGVVMRGLAPEVGDRYASADGFAAALADAAAQSFTAGCLRLSGVNVSASDAVTARLRQTRALDPPSAAETIAPPPAAAETIAARAAPPTPPSPSPPPPPAPDETIAAPVFSNETIAAPVASGPPPPAPAAPAAPPPPPAGGPNRVPLVLGVAAVVVVGVVLLLLLLSGGGGGGGEKKATTIGPKTVKVPGTVAWTDTGIDLRKGDDLRVTASGIAFHAIPDRNLFNGPDGVPNRPDLFKFNVVPNVNHDGLIGRIGYNGQPFNVGASFQRAVTSGGRLLLGINDIGVANNDGGFDATVTVTRP